MIVAVADHERPQAIQYLAAKLQMRADSVVSDDKFVAFFACRGERPNGVVLFKNFTGCDIEMVVAGELGWVTPGVIKFALSYPFLALNCDRITCQASRRNKQSRKFLERLGFQFEGKKRKALNGVDLMIYGLLRDESRWA